jgi:pimeloyl-ACP methyl ester carboxylesterase
VGPSRLHVQVARALAPHGFAVLRFDFSGIGDSEARRDGLAFEQSAVLEAQEAMDYLASTKGSTIFTLWGLCSGADAAFLTAHADPRVTCLIQLDAWIYPTWKYQLLHYAPKLLNAKSWKNLLTGKTVIGPFLRRLSGAAVPVDGEPVGTEIVVSHYAREFPPKPVVEAQLKALLDRGVRLLYLFSGGLEEVNYGGQYEDCFAPLGVRNRITVKYDPTADHIYSGLRHQRMVLETTVSWLLITSPQPSTLPAPG